MKLKTGYGDYTPENLARLGGIVAINLLVIAILAGLKPTAAEVDTATRALVAAIAMSGLGRAEAIEAAFATLAKLLGQVAMNAPQVAGVTDVDLAKIGLPEVETPVRDTVPPPACENVYLDRGPNPGDVVGGCKSMGEKIRLYQAQWTLDPTAATPIWSEPVNFANSRKLVLTGLPRGKDVWVRIRAVNTMGNGPWSDPSTIMVA